MSASPSRPVSRRTDLDLLRIAASAAIILAHAVLIFTSEPRYHVKSATPRLAADLLYEALRIGTLPLFFALAGWSAVAALRRRGSVRFLRERAERVLLPLLAGMLLLGPVISLLSDRGSKRIPIDAWWDFSGWSSALPPARTSYWWLPGWQFAFSELAI